LTFNGTSGLSVRSRPLEHSGVRDGSGQETLGAHG